ncbi:enoyl-CoA hydratase/isomerase family protein [Amycolatopsis sp. FDAARGOS 1241]|uniref:enoyl-CoA hydratase/isomerase family protein n=1 Tax=Amycolatopsis sp. FDAARGOS 1241 TaxID=2778070 RepID=UPI001951F2E8|nr:enoyl-CoA hydratase/isomerase family protein [Amycolatopsis sp. FDAARGOS 1241]QRP43094.1 enoyl-CoA hydratase/isomerase family protein [Amycolatopsis sp. FDAARGOS 1241]
MSNGNGIAASTIRVEAGDTGDGSGVVAVLTIDSPAKLNAMGRGFWPELREALSRLATDGRTRAVIITGAGDKAFSAGGDIASFAELTDVAAKREFQQDCMRTFAAVEESPLPIIAAVNGFAMGGGCELALACDVVVAADTAMFGMPECSVGLVPGFGVLRAPSVIGRQWTKLMMFGGERVDAATALRIGLAQKVVPAGELLSAARELAGRFAAMAPLAVATGKNLVNRGVDRGEFDHSTGALTTLHATADAAEGIAAFLGKRAPRFEGR